MQNNVIDRKIVDEKLNACGIEDMEDATIRDIVKTVNMIEAESGSRFIRMEMGVPSGRQGIAAEEQDIVLRRPPPGGVASVP